MIRMSLPLLISLILLLSACASLLYPPEKTFPLVQRDFSQRLRWLDIPGAARHFTPELSEEFLARFKDQQDLHITDVQLESTEYRPEAGRMLTWTNIEYYRLPSNVIQKHRFFQEWEYTAAGAFQKGAWHAITPIPELPFLPRQEQN